MFDDIAVSESGQVFLEEDPGNNAYVAKQWLYDIESGKLVQIAQHDPARFSVGGTAFLTQDEESSGVIDASEILGKGWYLFDTQAHFPTAPSSSRVASCRRSTSRPGRSTSCSGSRNSPGPIRLTSIRPGPLRRPGRERWPRKPAPTARVCAGRLRYAANGGSSFG